MDTMNERIDDSGHDRAWVSALADGQLAGEGLERALDAISRDPAARQAWQAYHLIGDVLRAQDLAGVTAPGVFLARFALRLAAEP